MVDIVGDPRGRVALIRRNNARKPGNPDRADIIYLLAEIDRLEQEKRMRIVEVRPGELVEQLAALSHSQWSGWTRWMIDQWSPESVARWERQIVTPYAELSEKEKESDRIEARKVIAVLTGVTDGK